MNNSSLLLLPSIIAAGAVLAYLLGSIPVGLILGKLFGAGDIRKIGSGNIGATNMMRTGKKTLAAATLVLDMLKGVAAIISGRLLLDAFLPEGSANKDIIINTDHVVYFYAVYAVTGHIWPIWLGFKGGKGVATSIGVYLAVEPLMGLGIMLCWVLVFYRSRYSSLAAIISLSLAPLAGYIFFGSDIAVMGLVLAVIVIARHKDNIRRLLQKTETKWEMESANATS
jgi:acyl phosphate:glycerol-3-phosphate acyltransferase